MLPVFWNKALLVLVLGVGVLLFAHRMLAIARLVRAGREGEKPDHTWARLSIALLYVFGQIKVLRSPAAGVPHAIIFYGFLAISLGTLNILWSALFDAPFLPAITESPYFVGSVDVFAVLVIIAVLASGYRRYVVKPPEVLNSRGSSAILALIFLLMATLLIDEAADVVLQTSAHASPVVSLLSPALAWMGAPQLATVSSIAWWLHILLLIGFLVHIPYSKHVHLLICPLNGFLRALRPKGQLRAADVDSPYPIGAGTYAQLTGKQILDLFACTECGRCLQYCPTYLGGRPLAPRQMILDLRNGLSTGGTRTSDSGANRASVADAIGREAIWACTTCRACQEHCPVFVGHVDTIVDARRYLLDAEGVPPTLSRALEGLTLAGNPQMLPPEGRSTHLEALGVPLVEPSAKPDLVYWLGCVGAFEPKAQETALAIAKILRAAGVDFAILGSMEKCCGDPARRVGEEGLFQELARQNIENLRNLGVKRLLTSCPHCYNTFRNEYPLLGAEFSVVHHADFILDLLRAKRFELGPPSDDPVAFHDPCYLGRYNGIYGAPRQVLKLLHGANALEMKRNRDKSLCCGGGGGQMYLEATGGTRIGHLRLAEARQLPVRSLVTACPFCKIMLDDASQYDAQAAPVRVKDIAELVCDAARL